MLPTDTINVENLGEARLIARSGAMLFVGAGLVALINSSAPGVVGVSGVDAGRLLFVGVLSIVSAGVVLVVPWARLAPRAPVAVAFWGLVLLLASGQWAGYAATGQAPSGYPAFFMLIFGWLGLTQPRATSVLFAPVAVLGCGWLTVVTPRVTVSFAGLFVAVTSSVLIAETIAWAMDRSRRQAHDLRTLVTASSELRGVEPR